MPVAPASDPRLVLLERQATAATVLATLTDQEGAAATREPALQAFLAVHTQAELVALLSDLAQRFPEVRNALAVRQMLTNDNADQLKAEVLGRIIPATVEPGGRNR